MITINFTKVFIRVILWTVKGTVQVLRFGKINPNMKVNGSTTRWLDTDNTHSSMRMVRCKWSTMALSKMVSSNVLEPQSIGITEIISKETLMVVSSMDMERWHLEMDHISKVILTITNIMVKERWSGQIQKLTKAIGNTARCVAKVSLHSHKTKENMRETSMMVISKDGVH